MMGVESTVSVIIPTYDRCELLLRALRSVCAQSLPPHEIIVVDDGSTDESRSAVAEHFPDVRYFYQENAGVSAARNLGISRAAGHWIALLDSDDEWLPTKLEKQMSALAAAPAQRVCHSNEIWIRHGKRVNQMKKHQKYGGEIFSKCLSMCRMSPSSIVIRRDVFDDIGSFDPELPACEDYDMWLRITLGEPVLFLDEPLIVKYGGHEDQLSRKYWGLDRFRIQSLERLLEDQRLVGDKRVAVLDELVTKTTIYINGANKRGKLDAVRAYSERLATYTREREHWRNDAEGDAEFEGGSASGQDNNLR